MQKISKDDYENWKDSEVTRRFFQEIEENLRNAESERIPETFSMEQVFAMNAARNEAVDVLENVLNWKPLELIDDGDNRA